MEEEEWGGGGERGGGARGVVRGAEGGGVGVREDRGCCTGGVCRDACCGGSRELRGFRMPGGGGGGRGVIVDEGEENLR